MCAIVAYRRTTEATGKVMLPSSSLDLKFLQYIHPINATPKQKYANTIHPHVINSAPSSLTTKGATISSPPEPPSYKSAVLSTSDTGSCSDASPQPDKIKQMNQSMPLKRRRAVDLSEEEPQTPIGVRHRNPSSSKRKNKGNNPNIATSSSSQRQEQNAASHTTLIRRVQAVVHIKREESEDDLAEDVSGAAKDEASDVDEVSRAIQRRSSRKIGNFIVDDEQNVESRHLRHRNGTINYREEDEDEDDVDELMIGAEVHITWISYFSCLTYNFRVTRSLALNFQSHSHYNHPRKGVNWLHDDRGLAFNSDIPCIIILHDV